MTSSSRVRSRRAAAVAVLLLGLAFAPRAGLASESTYGDRPVGDSVEELDGALARAVEERRRLETLFPTLKRLLGRFPNFVADTEVVMNARTFAFPLRALDAETAHAWTLRGKIRFRSGWWREALQIGAGVYTSGRILSDDPQARTGLLRPDDKGFAVFGEAFATTRWGDNEATLGRMELDLPYVNINDSRMTPNTFQGVFGRGVGRGVPALKRLDWVAGFLTDIRPRNEDDFISMAERAGARDGDEGMALLGIQFRPSPRLSLGLYDYFVHNTLNIAYLAADYTWKLSADWSLRFGTQATWQTSVGDEQIGDFEAWVADLRVAGSYRSITAWLAFSRVGDDSDIRSPYGNYPGYVSLMQSDFNRANERAWVVGASFAPKIAPRWSGFFQYARGDGGRDALGLDQSDEEELNLTVDYRLDEGRFRGLWFRVRGSVLDREDAPSRGYEGRFILNYTLPIL